MTRPSQTKRHRQNHKKNRETFASLPESTVFSSPSVCRTSSAGWGRGGRGSAKRRSSWRLPSFLYVSAVADSICRFSVKIEKHPQGAIPAGVSYRSAPRRTEAKRSASSLWSRLTAMAHMAAAKAASEGISLAVTTCPPQASWMRRPAR